MQKKGKEKKWIYIAPLLKYLTLKALRYTDHTVLSANYTVPASTS